ALVVGGALLAPVSQGGGPGPSSRVPVPESEPADTRPPVLRPSDLARAEEKAPPAVAALYRALSKPDLKAAPPYEEKALQAGEAFLKAEPEALGAAETALSVVLRFHLSARDRPLAGPNPWEELEGRLRRKLLDVRLRELGDRASSARDEKGWAEA